MHALPDSLSHATAGQCREVQRQKFDSLQGFALRDELEGQLPIMLQHGKAVLLEKTIESI